MICEYYWFTLNRSKMKQARRGANIPHGDLFHRVNCTNRAVTFYTPTHPYKNEPKWTRGRHVCESCLKSMKIQDDLQRELQNGTLFND